MLRLACASLLICLALGARAHGAPVITRGCSYLTLARYEPRVVPSIGDLPSQIRQKVLAHVQRRVGSAFFAKLHVCRIQAVDFADWHQKDPGWAEYQWEMPAYIICFCFSDPDRGIQSFGAAIRLRRDGTVIEELGLPAVARHPERGRFISVPVAYQIAADAGFHLAQSEKRLDYDRQRDMCVYTFEEVTSENASSIFYKVLEVEAHTGRRLRLYQQEGMK
jgi:hypothetical protein